MGRSRAKTSHSYRVRVLISKSASYAYICVVLCDWSDSEILDSLKLGELRNGAKTKAGPLEAEQLSRLGNIALVG